VSFELRATNFALDEIVNWSDFSSETARSGPNNLGISLYQQSLYESISATDLNLGWSKVDQAFIDLPRTFVVYVNETQQRQIAIEIEDFVGPMDSDA